MPTIHIHDKKFDLFIEEERILAAIVAVAEKMNNDLDGQQPVFLCVLNGSFMFASDLLKNIVLDCEVSFVKMASYEGTSSTGTVNKLIGLKENIKGRNVVIVEDIVDTGATIDEVYKEVMKLQPATVKIATLLVKPEVYNKNLKLDYVAISLANDFIIGYGLDYDGYGRNLRDIYKLKQ